MERHQLFKIVKNTNYGRSFFVKLFWVMKLMPIIDYACEIWTVGLDKDIFKKIKELQVKYLRGMYKLGKTSCIKSIFMESSVVNVNIRLHACKEKYIWKNYIKKTPESVWKLYDKRNELYRYEGEVKYDPQFETGYPNVSINTGDRGKYRSILYLKKRRKIFVGNNAKKVEKDRKKWINQNARTWTDSIKHEESIFGTKRTKKLYESVDLIKNNEVENWRNILGNDTHKFMVTDKTED